ncbi:hypothetical protein [Thermobrachium celere]|uniref:Uncharacterized protein n=1 Tax=Thermobrachium celere DSM 8682 TaxID=941824 RepID=R7RQ50_9CLOT|nr:hypothetical protein [Thermobrachium celere]CDF57423.1 hypothetical protein TCEL_01337 [Thermobrachium celere DSM 8682]
MKKQLSFVIALSLVFGTVTPAIAKTNTVNLYEVFSNKKDKYKNEVGSQIYKWSMYLPNDAQIFKSDKANYFSMYTNSYQSNINLEVNRNKYNLTLEDILLRLENNNILFDLNDMFSKGKEYSIDIVKDEKGQKYIRIVKTNPFYDYYFVDDAAEENGDFIENRIYVANGYIYNLTVSMNGRFYKQHKEMFNKLISSFKTTFDSKNPYIKELTDTASVDRVYINKTYGYTMLLRPYWKTDTMNYRKQTFKPLYSIDELIGKPEEDSSDVKIQEGISVNVVSSAKGGEKVSDWANKEIELFKQSYNEKVYEILENKQIKLNGFDAYLFEVRFKTITSKSYVLKNIYIIGNGYKYQIVATMLDETYEDSTKKLDYDRMMNSFKLEKKYLSTKLGRLLSARDLVDMKQTRDIKLKKYDFKISVPKSFGSYDEMFSYDDNSNRRYDFEDNIKYSDGNLEYINISDMMNRMQLSVFASLSVRDMNEIMKQKLEIYQKDSEVLMGIAKVNIKSTNIDGTEIYRIDKVYDVNRINEFVQEDFGKQYNLELTCNQYQLIIKRGNDLYSISLTLPVANITDKNINTIETIFKSVTIKGSKYGNLNLNWKQRELSEFKSEQSVSTQDNK